jgi:hypothetical protein
MKVENISIIVEQSLIDWGVKHSNWEPEKVAKKMACLVLWNGPRFYNWNWAIHWDEDDFKVVNDFAHPRHTKEVDDSYYFCKGSSVHAPEVRYDFSNPVFN